MNCEKNNTGRNAGVFHSLLEREGWKFADMTIRERNVPDRTPVRVVVLRDARIPLAMLFASDKFMERTEGGEVLAEHFPGAPVAE